MAKVEAEKLERRELLAAQRTARTTAANARESTRARKQDTRRKVILGSLLVDAAEKDPHWRDTLDLLMARVIREQDRKVFAGWKPAVEDGWPTAKVPVVATAAGPIAAAPAEKPRWQPSATGHAPFSFD